MQPMTVRQRWLARKYFRLVYYVWMKSAKYFKNWIDEAEAVSAGQLALCRAAQQFDPSRGVKFKTYAFRAILRALQAAAQDSGLIHIPAHVFGPRGAEHCRAAAERAQNISQLHRRNRTGCDTGNDFEFEPAAPSAAEPDNPRLEQLTEALRYLEPKRRDVLDRYYRLGQSYAEIAADLGVTRSRIGQIVLQAHDYLREKINARVCV